MIFLTIHFFALILKCSLTAGVHCFAAANSNDMFRLYFAGKLLEHYHRRSV